MLLLVTLVATLVIAVGCGGSKTEETTVKTPEGARAYRIAAK